MLASMFLDAQRVPRSWSRVARILPCGSVQRIPANPWPMYSGGPVWPYSRSTWRRFCLVAATAAFFFPEKPSEKRADFFLPIFFCWFMLVFAAFRLEKKSAKKNRHGFWRWFLGSLNAKKNRQVFERVVKNKSASFGKAAGKQIGKF